MARHSKLSPDITKRIGENIALELPYSLAAEAAGITYQTFNVKKIQRSESIHTLDITDIVFWLVKRLF
jgi:hypothetical protein